MQLTGEYMLMGIHEVGCGIVLHENNLFDMYFIYGALDRHGYGTWKKISETEIELNTNYKDASPFTILKEELINNSSITITFPNYNKILLRETKVEIFTDEKKYEAVLSDEGQCKFPVNSVNKIIVTCMFYFDNPATLFPANKESNAFEILPNYNLPLVHFKKTRMKAEKNVLKGFLPVLDPAKEYTFEKN